MGATPAGEARLRHEGWILGLAAHPGVVTLVEPPLPSGSPAFLRTRAVAGRPLAAMDELSASELAGLGAAVATTVADLHDAGITHGRLSPDHIVVDTAGRPVLCGFSQAAADSPATARTADVMALGHTLAALVALGGGRPAAGPVLAEDARVSKALAQVLQGARARGGVGGHRGSARWLAERLGDDRFTPRLPSRALAPVPG